MAKFYGEYEQLAETIDLIIITNTVNKPFVSIDYGDTTSKSFILS